MYYYTILTLHIVFAGVWLINLASEPVLRNQIITNKNKSGERKFISLYLTFANLLGIIGAVGILFTGVFLVLNSAYGFFSMADNHWLATKQMLMVVLLIIIGVVIIPTAKKLRRIIGADLESSASISEDGYNALKKLYLTNKVINIIVFINFLFAITHRYIG
ncbi:MAG: hypothetical protein FD143_514 [Ignavibacteria bacterium]|nr:MAG: hypothetical protein FD143_514 [Ignavibacteria bacterium]KAF0161585.1 MAG: hypothetical protein FD188_702 [Ignavibacteria bacterium]